MAALVRRIICTAKAPKPVGPYNQAILYNNTLYCSGVLGMDCDGKLVPGGARAEAKQALVNIGYILEEAGTCYENILKSSIFLNDIGDFGAVNEVYKEFFKTDYPARSTYQVGKLPLSASVEIEVIAAVGKVQTLAAKL